jgi:uncharacterized protein YfkK (UPF0435 family)
MNKKFASAIDELLSLGDMGMFNANKVIDALRYANEAEEKLTRYFQLVFKEEFTPSESQELFELNIYFKERCGIIEK